MKTWVILLFSLLVGHSYASEMDDRTNQTKPKAGDCLRSHWEAVLLVCDFNMDGKISYKDMEPGRKLFLGVNKDLDERVFGDWYTDWFNRCVCWYHQEIAEQDYGVIQKNYLLKDNGGYVERMKRCEDLWRWMMTFVHNKIVSEREYVIAVRAIENKDKKYIKDLENKWMLVKALDALVQW